MRSRGGSPRASPRAGRRRRHGRCRWRSGPPLHLALKRVDRPLAQHLGIGPLCALGRDAGRHGPAPRQVMGDPVGQPCRQEAHRSAHRGVAGRRAREELEIGHEFQVVDRPRQGRPRLDQLDVRLEDRAVFGRQAWRDLFGADDPALARLDHDLGGGGIGPGDLEPHQHRDRGHERCSPEDDPPAPAQDRQHLAQRKPALGAPVDPLRAGIGGLGHLAHGVFGRVPYPGRAHTRRRGRAPRSHIALRVSFLQDVSTYR
ncbi:MAG: hypothetical protein K0R41_3770 [Geminicoccaceae bacterium]|nr:hypothetical protein [Geminicoccaceae bacterium]